MNAEDVVKLKLIAQIELELLKMSEDNINVIKDVVANLAAEQAAVAEIGGENNE